MNQVVRRALLFRSWKWRRHVPPKHRLTFNGLHGVISQKTALLIIIFTEFVLSVKLYGLRYVATKSKSHCDWPLVSKSVSQPWCHDEIFITVWQSRSCLCGASSLTRGRVMWPQITFRAFKCCHEIFLFENRCFTLHVPLPRYEMSLGAYSYSGQGTSWDSRPLRTSYQRQNIPSPLSEIILPLVSLLPRLPEAHITVYWTSKKSYESIKWMAAEFCNKVFF
jgi:hypothetical protein